MYKWLFVLAIFWAIPLWAMDSEERLTLQEEELRLLQEAYDGQINRVMGDMNEKDSSAFF